MTKKCIIPKESTPKSNGAEIHLKTNSRFCQKDLRYDSVVRFAMTPAWDPMSRLPTKGARAKRVTSIPISQVRILSMSPKEVIEDSFLEVNVYIDDIGIFSSCWKEQPQEPNQNS
jgi:hypothetical protein